MIARVDSVALIGMEGHPIEVEVSISQGLPAFTIVGLPDPSIQEARERVRSAILASEEEWPVRRLTVNLSPAHLRKTGSSFDLAMALGVLVAAGRIPQERLRGLCVLGELSLDGTVRRIRGVLPAAITAAAAGARGMLVPAANVREAGLVTGLEVFPIDHLGRAVRFLRGECGVDAWSGTPVPPPVREAEGDLADVRGNGAAKRAIEIAAAGGHNVLMVGPPGGGKTMLARRMSGILPPMTERESFEVTRVHSVAGLLPDGEPLVTRRPYRAPHHSGSMTGLVGGGSNLPHPGEVSLAHRGVLFLDEYGEFRREALQALRQPMEDGIITIVRSRFSVTFPARFQLVAASNPCPCGHLDDPVQPCRCLPGRLASYGERLTGPVIDRIDIQIGVSRLTGRQLFGAPEGDSSDIVADRVAIARERQRERWGANGATCNAELGPRDLDRACRVQPAARANVEAAVERIGLTARGAHRVIRVARTIADLAGNDAVCEDSVNEALTYRVLETKR